MSYEITGTIIEIQPEQQFASGFSKREFVVNSRDKYPQPIKLEFTKDKCAQLDRFQPGDPVKVHFNLRGNEHQGRYFVNLVAWKIEPEESAAASHHRQHGTPARPVPAQTRQASFYDEGDADDVPY